MKRLNQTLPLILAAMLQLLPLLRNLVTTPAASSSFAFILRWGVGSAAAFGAFDACSAATTVVFNTPTNFNGAVGNYFTNYVSITNNGGDSGAYFILNNNTIITGHLSAGMTTTSCMPNGITFKVFDPNNGGSPKRIYCAMYGTPTTPGTNLWVHIQAGYSSLTPAKTDIYFTIVPASAGLPPTITNQPASLTNTVGSNPTLSVTAGGTAPLSYQWYFNTNTSLLNMTNSSLTLTNIQLTNAGYYRVSITNSAGATNSFNALLTVIQPPVITNNPVSFTNVAGGNATFTVLAGGSAPLAYQWYFNTNTTLSDATNTSFPLTGIRASQTGSYLVIITNAGGSVTSTPASLVVTNPLPTTLTTPANNGGVFQFTFIPVVGLTNSVQTNSVLSDGDWAVLTNVPPPATASPITVSDPLGGSNRFYRVQVSP